MGTFSPVRLARPSNEKRTVGRKANAKYRTREHLTEGEVERLIATAKDNRYGDRDATMLLVAFRHGLRVSELVDLRWEQVDLNTGVVHVRRVKQGSPATHPLTGRELRALRRLERESAASPFVFISERGTPFSTPRFSGNSRTGRTKCRF
jgi:type 1 fimbriae regulatory protein FimB/type 1 fimbriae regulatory protein FimE